MMTGEALPPLPLLTNVTVTMVTTAVDNHSVENLRDTLSKSHCACAACACYVVKKTR